MSRLTVKGKDAGSFVLGDVKMTVNAWRNSPEVKKGVLEAAQSLEKQLSREPRTIDGHSVTFMTDGIVAFLKKTKTKQRSKQNKDEWTNQNGMKRYSALPTSRTCESIYSRELLGFILHVVMILCGVPLLFCLPEAFFSPSFISTWRTEWTNYSCNVFHFPRASQFH